MNIRIIKNIAIWSVALGSAILPAMTFAAGVPSANPTVINQQTIQPNTSYQNYNIYSGGASFGSGGFSSYSSSGFSNSAAAGSYPQAQSPFQPYQVSTPAGQQTLSTVINLIAAYLNQALVLFMAFAIVMFVWNVIQYFIKADADRSEAGQYVLYSVIGFFVILSIWGIVNILTNTFGLGNGANQVQSWASFANIFPQH